MNNRRDGLFQETTVQVTSIPGVTPIMQDPVAGLDYLRRETVISGAFCTAFALFVIAYGRFEWGKFETLVSLYQIWIVIIALVAAAGKVLFRTVLPIQPAAPADTRIMLYGAFRKGIFTLSLLTSKMFTVSVFFAFILSIWGWLISKQGSLFLMVYPMVLSIKLFYSIEMYSREFLKGAEGAENKDNPYGFRVITYKAEEVRNSEPRLFESTCSICMGDYEENDKVYEFACPGGHYYHIGCLNDWLKNRNTCPLCKAPVYI